MRCVDDDTWILMANLPCTRLLRPRLLCRTVRHRSGTPSSWLTLRMALSTSVSLLKTAPRSSYQRVRLGLERPSAKLFSIHTSTTKVWMSWTIFSDRSQLNTTGKRFSICCSTMTRKCAVRAVQTASVAVGAASSSASSADPKKSET